MCNVSHLDRSIPSHHRLKGPDSLHAGLSEAQIGVFKLDNLHIFLPLLLRCHDRSIGDRRTAPASAIVAIKSHKHVAGWHGTGTSCKTSVNVHNRPSKQTTLTRLEHVTFIGALDARSLVQRSSAVVGVDGVLEVALCFGSVVVNGWQRDTHHASTVFHFASLWIVTLVCHGKLDAMAAS